MVNMVKYGYTIKRRNPVYHTEYYGTRRQVDNKEDILSGFWSMQNILQHVGDVSEQKIKCRPIRTREIGGVRL